MQEFAGECTPRLLWVSLWQKYRASSSMYLAFPMSFAHQCKYLASAGAAGRFSRRQLALLDACIPGGIRFQETDAQVRLYKSSSAGCWLAMLCEALRAIC